MLPVLLFLASAAQLCLGAEPVTVGVYYETLCPDSIRFVLEQMKPAFDNLRNITEFELVPYGKATQQKSEGKWRFSCQHGPRECDGNQFQTCAIQLYPDISIHFPLIYCMESKAQPDKAGKQCTEELVKKGISISYDKIESCTKSNQGNEWQHQMGDKTEKLDPPLHFVPWVTINGVHTNALQKKALSNLSSVICDAYKGEKPSSCSS